MPSSTISNNLSKSNWSLARLNSPMCKALFLTYLWINASEIFRYFVFVMPMTRSAMPQVANAAPMSLPVFLVWGLWDTLLFASVSVFIWLYLERFRGGVRSILEIGTLLWAAIFGIFWLATWNMNMTSASVPLVALPFAWLEMVIAAAILEWGWRLGGVGRRSE